MKFPYVSAIIGAALAISGCVSNDTGSTKAVASAPASKPTVAAAVSAPPKATPAVATSSVAASNERRAISIGDELVVGRYNSIDDALADRNKQGEETITVVDVTTDGTTLSNKTVYDKNGNTIRRNDSRRGIVDITPSQMVVPEGEIKVGMTWPVKYTERFADGSTRTFEGKATVVNTPTVSLPAGTFQTWYVVQKGTWTMGNQSGDFELKNHVAPALDNRNVAGESYWKAGSASGRTAFALTGATLASQSVAEMPRKN